MGTNRAALARPKYSNQDGHRPKGFDEFVGGELDLTQPSEGILRGCLSGAGVDGDFAFGEIRPSDRRDVQIEIVLD